MVIVAHYFKHPASVGLRGQVDVPLNFLSLAVHSSIHDCWSSEVSMGNSELGETLASDITTVCLHGDAHKRPIAVCR